MRARSWTWGFVALVVALGCVARPGTAVAHPSPLDSLTLDFVIDQSGLVVIDGAANRDSYDAQSPSPAERAALADQVVHALGIPGDTAQVDAEKSDLYHEVGFRISLHAPFSNAGDGAVRIDTGPLQAIAASLGTLTLDVCRDARLGLGLEVDASAPATPPDPAGAGAPFTDRADCRTWVSRADDPPVVVTAHVTSSSDSIPDVDAHVVLRCGVPSAGDPSYDSDNPIASSNHTLQAHASGASSPGVLEADIGLAFTTRSRVDVVVPKAQVGHFALGAPDGPRATRRLTVPECKYAQARPWTWSAIRIWADRVGCFPVRVKTPRSARTFWFAVGAPCPEKP